MKPGQRILGLFACLLLTTASHAASSDCPQTTSALYSRIRSIGLDPQRVYHIREAAIDRPSLHLDFVDGTIAFTENLCGRITGAFFEGEGEVRLRPPNRMERGSLALFTGMALLEEQFESVYLRFNDDTADLLKPFLTTAAEPAEFVKEWDDTSRTLAEFDGLRLLLDFSHYLPAPGGNSTVEKFPALLHAHLLGNKLGGFEVVWDAAGLEQLWAGQPRVKDSVPFFDIWTSFAPPAAARAAPATLPQFSIDDFRINATVQPPTKLQASTEVDLHIHTGGERTILFELSRYLRIDSVEADGAPVDFIQNGALEGTELQRKGNDLVAVIFPAPLRSNQAIKLRFRYAGDVLTEAGSGLLYVGARGTWYPNFGLSPAHFEMEFHYPAPWTLVATGKRLPDEPDPAPSSNEPGAERISRWTSDRPIPVAGFNLGKYLRAEAKSGNILVEAYGTKGVEKSFPQAPSQVVQEPTFGRTVPRTMPHIALAPPPPSPARDAQEVADKAARAIASFSQWFGPYPYSSLALTQMPGDLSQGWPGLVFLSSFAFLSPQEQRDLHLDPVTSALDSQVLVHETAHQWWGDLVLWRSYRDQWLAEGLANYSSLLLLERKNPAAFRQILEQYRRDLLGVNKDGERLRDAGPVTLGRRLESSHFPGGYDFISYERGTWLFHMLRCMLRDSEAAHAHKGHSSGNADEPFFSALRKVRERYAGKTMSTEDFIKVFEEELPRPLWYENRHNLDWFLEGWINGTAIPELQSREIRITEKGGVTTVTGMIVQKDAPEDLVTAVPVYATTAANTTVFLGEVLADGPETSFRLTAPGTLHKILLDPRQTILTAPK